jgi:ABC-type polysaccharide/polyol phosphate transport system ATPase subunit
MSASSSNAPAVVVDRLAKQFRLPYERSHTLKERALHPFRKARFERLDALEDISFTVPQGEFFGIVGRNGSGKSTLLKCLAGIYRADAGTIGVAGRMSTFIELGVGFNPDLAAYDNVLTNAIMLGLTPREAAKRFDRVLAFAELEEFVDLKIKNYSSGMLVRLAFSVAIEAEADVLLIDEVLAVGDAAFQQKCFDVFNRMRDEGRTMLFVTHDMGMVERFCDRAMLLERGRMVCVDEPHVVAQRYLELNFADAAKGHPELGSSISGDGSATIETIEAFDEQGTRAETFLHGSSCLVRLRVRFDTGVTDPVFSVVVVNEQSQNVFAASNSVQHLSDERFTAGDVAEVDVRFDVVMAPGRYHLSAVVSRPGTAFDIMHRVERAASFVVINPTATGGLVDLPFELGVRHATEPAREGGAA